VVPTYEVAVDEKNPENVAKKRLHDPLMTKKQVLIDPDEDLEFDAWMQGKRPA
jgi:hypothetical protein